MKLTKNRLKEIIREEILNEGLKDELAKHMKKAGLYDKEFEEYLKKASRKSILKRVQHFRTT